MAVQTKGDEGKEMADERSDAGPARNQERDDERDMIEADDHSGRGPTTPAPVATGGGFLSVYKPGQGYWTRMCTAAGALLLILFTSHFVYTALKTRASVPNAWALGVAGLVALVAVVFGWRYMNKPHVGDFLIATESEMKKVNWTSRKELIGSTKVVILFMLLISAILFFVDIAFGYFFYLIDVLKHPPL